MAKVTFTTPIGVARFPKISKPDTTGDYADNKYKTDLVLTDEELKALKAQIMEFGKKEFGDEKFDLPIKEYKDKESGQVTKFVRFKSARKPIIIDAKRNPIPADVEIGGGSRIRIGGTLNCYRKGPNKGVNIYLNAVQVIELQQGFNVKDFDEYDGEDAYVAEAADAASDFDL